MSGKVLTYDGKQVTVTYEVKRCIHASECVHGAPEVFNPEAKPWVTPDGASVDKLTAVIERCPTGALHYVRKDGGPAEMPSARNSITVSANGPLYLRGQVQILDAAGQVTAREMRVALCRCGASASKPLCDGSHAKAGFVDAAAVAPTALRSDRVDTADGVLRITLLKNAPLQVRGPFDLVGAAAKISDCNEAWLCRCGGSKNRPFCDGTHKKIGFSG